MAENSSRCPPAGVSSRMRVTAGRNPRSAMWSASSSTEISMPASVQAPRSSRSISRPGVATTMSTPSRSRPICRGYGTPPYTVVTLTPTDRPSGVSTSATCWASSRVGTSTRPRGAWPTARPGPPDPASRASMGSPNASVLPEPVCARPSTSRPSIASGSARAWIANGSLIFRAASALISRSGRPSSANDAGAGAGRAAASDSARSSPAYGSACGGRTGRGPLRRAGPGRGVHRPAGRARRRAAARPVRGAPCLRIRRRSA